MKSKITNSEIGSSHWFSHMIGFNKRCFEWLSKSDLLKGKYKKDVKMDFEISQEINDGVFAVIKESVNLKAENTELKAKLYDKNTSLSKIDSYLSTGIMDYYQRRSVELPMWDYESNEEERIKKECYKEFVHIIKSHARKLERVKKINKL